MIDLHFNIRFLDFLLFSSVSYDIKIFSLSFFFFILSLKNKYKFSLPIKRTYYPRWFLYDNKDCLLSFISHRIFIVSQIQEYIYKFLSKLKKIFQLRSIHFLFIFKIAESYHISQFKIKERINYNLEKLTSKLDVWVSRGITSRQSIKRPITKAIRAYRDFNYPFTSTFHVAPPPSARRRNHYYSP